MKIPGTILLLSLITPVCVSQNNASLVTRKLVDPASGKTIEMPVDTALAGSQQHNPLYDTFFSWNELGNTGLPAINHKYVSVRNALATVASLPYEAYRQHPGMFEFYSAKNPYTLVNYNSGGAQDKHGQTIHGLYGRNLKRQGNLTFLGTYVNSDGHYSNQKNNASFLQVSYALNRGDYSLLLGLNRQSFNSGENGGLRDESALKGASYPGTLAVRLSSASSNTAQIGLSGWQSGPLSLKRKHPDSPISTPPDSMALRDSIPIQDTLPTPGLVPERSSMKWEHQFSLSDFKRVYSDNSPPAGFYPMVTGGLDNFADSIRFTVFQNEIRIVPDSIRIGNMILAFKGGISPDFYRYAYQDTAFNGFRLGLNARAATNLGKTELTASARWIAAGFSAGDHDVRVHVNRQVGKPEHRLLLSVDIISLGSSPDPFVKNYQSNVYSWDNLFSRQMEQGITLGLNMPGPAFEFSVSGFTSARRIYFNSQGIPAQESGSSATLMIEASKKFVKGPFHSDIRLLSQYTSSAVVRLPLLTAHLTAFMHHDLHFKSTDGTLEVEYGLDFRYYTRFAGYSYMPATGMFYLQDESFSGNYPWLDLFAQIKVKRTRLFVQYCHTFADLLADYSFPTAHYPYMRPHLKYGVYWHFYD